MKYMYNHYHNTDPEKYYYTTRSLNSLHEKLNDLHETLHAFPDTLNGLHDRLNG